MMNELVANLKTAMAARIQHSDWMSAETKKAALEKLSKMDVMVGYPDKWRDYSTLKIDAGDLYGNVAALEPLRVGVPARRISASRSIARSGAMTPQTVNAYNGGLENKIVFPAGILQAPFFDPKADPAVNYGAIGAIIGHEISHGFDDQGRKIDATGAVRDWWTKADAERFDAQAKKFGAQYNAYEPVPGMHINGELTMGENIADFAGLLVAHDAYQASLKGAPAPVSTASPATSASSSPSARPGAARQRDDALRSQMTSDPHSPDASASSARCATTTTGTRRSTITGGKYYLKPEDAHAHLVIARGVAA